MYTKQRPDKTTIVGAKSYEGETIESKVRRILNNKEPIKDSAPIIHTERKDGVMPQFNIRADRFDLALEATDAKTKNHLALRDARLNPKTDEGAGKTGEPGTTQATSTNS